MARRRTSRRRTGLPGGCGGRILIALVLAAFAIGSYYFGTETEDNPYTGETQRLALNTEEEIMMGLQAAPQMAQQHGGLYPDEGLQQQLDDICLRLINSTSVQESEYRFECHLLRDDQTINAFALPGGQVFITYALWEQLDSEGEIAGVMGHEIGHVIGRHSSEQIAKTRLTEGLTGAAVVAAYDPENPTSAGAAQMAALVGQMINMRYGRQDELQADNLGVQLMAEAGYDPRSLIEVMRVLAGAGGGRQPEFFSTHPDPGNRIEQIEQAIEEVFPNGVPDGLIQ